MKTEHLLIIRFSALGDVAMTVPVIYSLAHQYPDVRITVLSKPSFRLLFENIAPNVGFMGADIKNDYKGIKGLNRLFRRLTAKKFTAVADFHSIIRSNYLRMRFNMSRYKVAHIDKHRQGKRLLTSSTNKILEQQPTAFQNYIDVLAKLDYPVKLDFTSIFPPEGGNLRLLSDSIGEKKKFQQWIGIAPFAAHQQKIYPIPMMEKVISLITKKHPSCRIFLFGKGKRENKVFSEWIEKYSQCINASSILKSFSKELILMSHLDVMLSMDSGNMHLASLVNIPVVSIWGATHPYAGFMGWNQREENIIQADLPCRPCSIYGNKNCLRGDLACLISITPQLVTDKIEEILSNK